MLKEKILIFKDEKLSFKNTIAILFLLGILSSIFGFIYETFFYRIDLGYFVKRGSTYGPWIPIYFFGGILIAIFSYRFKKNPLFVFLINCIVTGVLEFVTGFVFYEFFNLRLWDYNTEIWNFGNINGYICLRSVLFFGISSLILVYLLIPLLLKIYKLISEKKLQVISFSLFTIFALDIILHAVIKGFN